LPEVRAPDLEVTDIDFIIGAAVGSQIRAR
jgi:hypothetical protein